MIKTVIHLPQTEETLSNTIEPIVKRKVWASDENLLTILYVTKELLKEC